jgi:hypothetical protein
MIMIGISLGANSRSSNRRVARVLVSCFPLRLVMQLLREKSFWCEACGKNIVGKVYCEDSNPVPEEEKTKALAFITHYHLIDNHTMCWKCGKQIRSHGIVGMNWVRKKLWENLCGECV